MRKSLVVTAAIALAAVGIGANNAQAVGTCPNIFNVCMDFSLVDNGNGSWSFLTTYTSSPSGGLTATGVYYNAGGTAPNFGIGGLTLVSPLTGWQTGGCTDLSVNTSSTDLLSACGSTTHGINDAVVPPNGLVQIDFTANAAFATALSAGELDYRAHVQGYGPTNCSIKLDTGEPGNLASYGTDCVPPDTSVPEPISMVLLGSGLLGLGAVRSRRKQK